MGNTNYIEKESNEKKYIICNDPKLQTLTKATTEEEKVVSDKHTIEEEIKNQKILLMNDETIVSIKKEKEEKEEKACQKVTKVSSDGIELLLERQVENNPLIISERDTSNNEDENGAAVSVDIDMDGTIVKEEPIDHGVLDAIERGGEKDKKCEDKVVHAVKDINKNENENNHQEEKIITLDTNVTKKDENIKKLAIKKLITKEKKHEFISTNNPQSDTETVESSQSELGSESFKTRIQKIENKKKAKNAIAITRYSTPPKSSRLSLSPHKNERKGCVGMNPPPKGWSSQRRKSKILETLIIPEPGSPSMPLSSFSTSPLTQVSSHSDNKKIEKDIRRRTVSAIRRRKAQTSSSVSRRYLDENYGEIDGSKRIGVGGRQCHVRNKTDSLTPTRQRSPFIPGKSIPGGDENSTIKRRKPQTISSGSRRHSDVNYGEVHGTRRSGVGGRQCHIRNRTVSLTPPRQRSSFIPGKSIAGRDETLNGEKNRKLSIVPIYKIDPSIESSVEVRRPEEERCHRGKQREDHVECRGLWHPKLHQTSEGCERCLFFASKKELKDFGVRGGSPRIMMTKGGCGRDCKIFSRKEKEGCVRLCQKCFHDTHMFKLW